MNIHTLESRKKFEQSRIQQVSLDASLEQSKKNEIIQEINKRFKKYQKSEEEVKRLNNIVQIQLLKIQQLKLDIARLNLENLKKI